MESTTIDEEARRMALRLGDTAPDFTADTTEGRVSLHEYLGDGWGILFSHPADFTPVCTTELGEFARRKKEFDDRDTKLIGVSVDSVASHRQWSEDIRETQGPALNFPLIGDEDRAVAQLYGMIHPNALETATVRTVFVITPDKKIALTLTYPAAIGRNVDEIIRVLDALQLSTRHAVSTPVNWKDGDDVIISPAVSDEDARTRFPKGFTTLKPYLRLTPQPDREARSVTRTHHPAMTTGSALQQQARALGDPTRHAIFRYLADVGRPIGVAELNERFPLHHNAIRQHLAKLVAAGLVLESPAPGGGRGRPRLVYEVNPAVEGQWATSGPYERLSRLLLEIIRTGLDAEEVGRRAADTFRVPNPSGDAVADLEAAMGRQGFDPEVRSAARGAEVVLHRCPFAAVAVSDRATVCGLHLGIAEGLVAGTPTTVTELVAYEPRGAGCRIRLRTGADERGEDRRAGRGRLTLRGRRPRTPSAPEAGAAGPT